MNYDRKEFTVVHDPARATEEALLAAVRATSDEVDNAFVPSIGARVPTPEPESGLTEDERARIDQRTITRGDRVDLTQHVVRGKFTIFDYYADWCGPCHVLARELEKLALERSDVAIRKIDILDWKSEAAKQATADYKLPGLPYVRVYGPDGRLRGHVNGNDIAAVRRLVEAP